MPDRACGSWPPGDASVSSSSRHCKCVAELPATLMATLREKKVRRIFDRFDVNGDGGLDMAEMAALIAAVNFNVPFSADQISAILEDVFRTYSDFISDPHTGLSFQGLLQTYNDGAGDVDSDFEALFLSPVDARHCTPPRVLSQTCSHSWALNSPMSGAEYQSTRAAVQDLQILLRKGIRACNCKRGHPNNDCSTYSVSDFDKKLIFINPRRREFRVFLKGLRRLIVRINSAPTSDERFDGHMAVGRTLYDHHLFAESLERFLRAAEIRRCDVRVHYRIGNSLCSLGRLSEARASYIRALEYAELDRQRWAVLLPQIHVNLGVSLEGEGMLLNACENYRKAAILCPTHYRALKLLGSALFGSGEYEGAVKALEEAVLLKPDYADAHCDLGSVFHATGDVDRAFVEYQAAIDLKPDHLHALYNFGRLLMDLGRFHRAAEMYSRVLTVQPNHWRAQLNRAVSLLGAGASQEAKSSLRDAFNMTKRVELFDAISHVRHLQKRSRGRIKSMHMMDGGVNMERRADAVTEAPSKFKLMNDKSTTREAVGCALSIRAFQKATKLDRCNISLLMMEMNKRKLSASDSAFDQSPQLVRKAELELILRKFLNFLQPETFQGAVKAIEERILSVMDPAGCGRIDLGLFFAAIAPICAGSPEDRKRIAFAALHWRSLTALQGQISKFDAIIYLRYLSVIYFPSRGYNELLDTNGDEISMISFPEFLDMFDGAECGFGVMVTLVKLENDGRTRHDGLSCEACKYPITGPRFKEETAGFSLCAVCYSEGKVPRSFMQEEYRFREYWTNKH